MFQIVVPYFFLNLCDYAIFVIGVCNVMNSIKSPLLNKLLDLSLCL